MTSLCSGGLLRKVGEGQHGEWGEAQNYSQFLPQHVKWAGPLLTREGWQKRRARGGGPIAPPGSPSPRAGVMASLRESCRQGLERGLGDEPIAHVRSALPSSMAHPLGHPHPHLTHWSIASWASGCTRWCRQALGAIIADHVPLAGAGPAQGRQCSGQAPGPRTLSLCHHVGSPRWHPMGL